MNTQPSSAILCVPTIFSIATRLLPLFSAAELHYLAGPLTVFLGYADH